MAINATLGQQRARGGLIGHGWLLVTSGLLFVQSWIDAGRRPNIAMVTMLCSSILRRDIRKGKDARFVKADRSTFALKK